jgi:hypothetical protein
MITKTNFFALIIIILGCIIALQQCSFNDKEKELLKVNGKKYEVIKRITDTTFITRTKTRYVKGADIFHETIVERTKEVPTYTKVDTQVILRNYQSKIIYKDRLVLENGLGTIDVTDTISQNKIIGRKWNAQIKEKTITNTTIVKELPKTQVFLGFNGGFNKKDVISNVGAGVVVKTKKEKLYQIGIGVTNNVTDGTNGSLSPFINAGIFWKIKLGK